MAAAAAETAWAGVAPGTVAGERTVGGAPFIVAGDAAQVKLVCVNVETIV